MDLKKNMANCTPKEFLIQSNKIRKAAEKWLKVTDIMNIRKNVPKLEIPKGADPDEISKIMAEHREKVQEVSRQNLSDILDAMLEQHPDETLELLALLCFVEPKKVNDHKITEYLANVTEILNDKAVVDFFTSLIRLDQTGILSA